IGTSFAGSQADAERTRRAVALRPALPQVQPPGRLNLTACFRLVFNPEQLEHCVREEETPVGRSLPRMTIRAAFDQAEIDESLRFGRAHGRAHENVIDFDRKGAGHAAGIYAPSGTSTMLSTASAAPMSAPAATSLG